MFADRYDLAVSTASAAARDAPGASGSVGLDQPAYVAHEDQGWLTITIKRTGDLGATEHVGYGVKQQDGTIKQPRLARERNRAFAASVGGDA